MLCGVVLSWMKYRETWNYGDFTQEKTFQILKVWSCGSWKIIRALNVLLSKLGRFGTKGTKIALTKSAIPRII